MGKGYNNYMCKKDFHPGNIENLKRVWMAQQKHDEMKKYDADMKSQYQKEQQMIEHRQLLGDDKAKLGISFMYDLPPGAPKSAMKGHNENEILVEAAKQNMVVDNSADKSEDVKKEEFKFEWQRGAPRESYLKGKTELLVDQPFGIWVRNVKCLKCGKWGHVNIDKVCPLYAVSNPNLIDFFEKISEEKQQQLMTDMKKEGLALKNSGLDKRITDTKANQDLIPYQDSTIGQHPNSLTSILGDLTYIQSLTAEHKNSLYKLITKMVKKFSADNKSSGKRKLESSVTSLDSAIHDNKYHSKSSKVSHYKHNNSPKNRHISSSLSDSEDERIQRKKLSEKSKKHTSPNKKCNEHDRNYHKKRHNKRFRDRSTPVRRDNEKVSRDIDYRKHERNAKKRSRS